MKYLETNAIRKLAPFLGNIGFVNDKYTSVLALLEILSGIKDNNSFYLRQSIFKKVLRSQIKFDPNLPEIKIYNAFGFNLENLELSSKIGQILKLVELTKDYESLLKTINLNGLNDIFLFGKEYDENASYGLKKKLLMQFSNSEVKQAILQFESRWTQDNLLNLKNIVIRFIATILLENPIVKSQKSLSELISSYDNSIDIYLITITYYLDQKVSSKSFPAKNDYIDLNHLTYLSGFSNQIVTDDKLLHKIMLKTYPNNILKTSELHNKGLF
ncbi:hypothetical protein [Cognataquiflexum rubidum]|uniref:hypothetical protein n=1 Tax=Cognataquiflexum rubidum TaxID=2922273 RepID=UPI001F13144E|nr:hypothetical protein [Cognataquiflexum rubidum]MCH6232577.1 hypothetical protein [Cognataquiflexum rubidum]